MPGSLAWPQLDRGARAATLGRWVCAWDTGVAWACTCVGVWWKGPAAQWPHPPCLQPVPAAPCKPPGSMWAGTVLGRALPVHRGTLLLCMCACACACARVLVCVGQYKFQASFCKPGASAYVGPPPHSLLCRRPAPAAPHRCSSCSPLTSGRPSEASPHQPATLCDTYKQAQGDVWPCVLGAGSPAQRAHPLGAADERRQPAA